ncbi:MAG: hypothetical protein ACRD2U_02700 [Terriglobales bacterium]
MGDASVSAVAVSHVIEIGEIPIALHCRDNSFRTILENRYLSFLTPAQIAHSQFTVELTESPTDGDPEEDLQVKMQRGRWVIRRGDFKAEWDPARGTGSIRQPSNPYSLDAILRIVHSLILAPRGGFLVHAASAVRNGSAFLFAGVSGAGKTTISRLAPPDVTLLTDEISYIKPDGLGYRGLGYRGLGYRAFGTPFAGELSKPGENASAPVSVLYLLEKGPENRIEPVPRDQAIRSLLRNILFFADDPALVNSVFQSACDFLEKVPVRKLVFAPDQRIWEMIG